MSKTPISQWKRPIDGLDYASFVAIPIEVDPKKRRLFETKDSTSPTGYHLRAKVKMTFAGMRTGNKAMYLPDEHHKSAQSFIKPFPRPIIRNHDEDVDPMGRVIDVRYVDTTNLAIGIDARAAKIATAFRDSKTDTLKRVKTVSTLLDMSKNPDYSGMGHILGLWDVTDPDAIAKVLDGRYLTVSTAMAPEGAYCSSCALDGTLTDWKVDDCDHFRGDIVDGIECVAVPFNYHWEHVSPVNLPAAKLAQIVEVGDNLTFSDAKTTYNIPYELFTDVDVGRKERDGERIMSIMDKLEKELPSRLDETSIKTPTSKTDSVIEIQDNKQSSIQGNLMKITELLKDTAQNYEALAKFLPEGAAKLTGDMLSSLEDSIFLGPNRTFPAKDKNHLVAIKALLETVEDSETKAAILKLVEDATKKTAEVSPEATPDQVADSAPAASEPTPETPDLQKEIDELKAQNALLQEKISDFVVAKDLTEKRQSALESDIASLNAVYANLMKDYKGLLADTLADAQEARGFKIEDRASTVAKFKDRTIQSLLDQLNDLKSQPTLAGGRAASGEPAPDPTKVEGNSPSTDRSQYEGIFRQYDKLFYSDGPNGPIKAKQYLANARLRGLIPDNVEP